jgi:hypothetical protein
MDHDMSFPSPRLCVLSLLALAVSLAACGGDDDDGADDGADDGGCAPTEVDDFPDGALSRPEDLVPDEGDCGGGGLAGVDLSGRWSVVGQGQFSFEFPIVGETCAAGIGIAFEGYPDQLVHRDDSNLFWRTWVDGDDFHFAKAWRACPIPGSDELAVAIGRCTETGDEGAQCAVEQGRMKRFARPAGETEAAGLELVSEFEGGAAPWPDAFSLNVKVVDGIALVSRFGDLRLVDVSDPAAPVERGVVLSEDNPRTDFNDVKPFQAEGGTHAVLAGDRTPIVDARDPDAPSIVAKLGEYSHSVFVRQDGEGRTLAYLATYGPDVPIYDVSIPGEPALLERVPLPKGMAVHDLFADEDHLYLNGTGQGFQVMEREGESWSVLGALPSAYSHASWVAPIGDRLIAVDGDEGVDAYLRVVDVDPTSPAFMEELASYQTRPEVSIHNLMMFGTRVYLTYYQDGVRILDLADPTSPELIAHYHTFDLQTGGVGGFHGAIGLDVDVEAGLVYVADIDRGLLILRDLTAE